MDQMDERQIAVRGKVAMQTAIGMILYFMSAAFVNDFGLIDIEHTVGFSSFLIGSTVLMITFLSVSLILRDAYMGVFQDAQFRICLFVFTFLAIAEDGLFMFDLFRGEGVAFVSLTLLLLVNSVAISLWIKRKDWRA